MGIQGLWPVNSNGDAVLTVLWAYGRTKAHFCSAKQRDIILAILFVCLPWLPTMWPDEWSIVSLKMSTETQLFSFKLTRTPSSAKSPRRPNLCNFIVHGFVFTARTRALGT